ncbi:MAG: AraC family transcriptional regulator [Bacteroidota bacterium]
MILPANYQQGRELHTLVENRTTYNFRQAEMNIFETHEVAKRVQLNFSQPVLASMITGKKVMHLRDQPSFAFVPGESVMLPSHEEMCIDFPTASLKRPTKCLALEVDQDVIARTITLLNEQVPKQDHAQWQRGAFNLHFSHTDAVQEILQRLLYLCVEDHPNKDIFVNMMVSELLIRILQAESKHTHLQVAAQSKNESRLGYIINYIKENLGQKLTIKELSQQAYMSESHFSRVFKQEMGCSPIEFINEQRLLLATQLLTNARVSVTEIYLSCGFNSLSYFNRLFKRKHDLTPGEYRQQQLDF